MSNETPKLVPSAGVAVRDDEGRILLVRRADDHTWALPGGRMDVGESLLDCARRECREETGWDVTVTGLLGVYSDPRPQTHRYPDGRFVQFAGVVFEGRLDSKVGEPDEEVSELEWFGPDDLPGDLFAPDTPTIADALSDAPRPFVR